MEDPKDPPVEDVPVETPVEPAPEMYGPTKPFEMRPAWFGKRYSGHIRRRDNGTPIMRRVDKTERRIRRKAVQRMTKVGMSLSDARMIKQQARAASKNAKAAKRLLEADRKWREKRKQEELKQLLKLKMEQAK